tara:strand:+ start:445 stop:588 length:144 start_codon:yes stop_codon:yes gene_type:complete
MFNRKIERKNIKLQKLNEIMGRMDSEMKGEILKGDSTNVSKILNTTD